MSKKNSGVSHQSSDSPKVLNLAQARAIRTLPDQVLDQKEVFRQKRIDNSGGLLKLEVGKDSYQLLNWSRTGLAFQVAGNSNPFPVGLKIGPAKIYVGSIPVFEGDIEIKSVRDTSEGQKTLGAQFRSKLFLVEGIESASVVNRFASLIEIHQEEMKEIDPKVCKLIVDMGSTLRALKKVCEEEHERTTKMTFDERAEALSIFLPNMSKEVKKIFDAYSKDLGALVDVENLAKATPYHRLFEEHIYPFLKGADLSRRAFEKPRGYDGDYEMMNQVYRQNFEGTDLMGKVLHHYSINTETNESVQFRRPYFMSKMEKCLDYPGNKSFLSVASGPAREVQDAVARWTQQNLDRTTFVLFDLDREALEHAQTKIFEVALEQNKSPNVDFINASVKSFLKHHENIQEGFDLIYSGGLFDYLDNMTSTLITQNLFKMLKPGGRLVIGNFTKAVTSKGFISLILKWHLIYKTEEEMRAWAKDIHDCTVTVDYDPNGINAFLVVEKK